MIHRIGSVGLTVRDMTQTLNFYTRVLPFEIVDDVEVVGTEWELLQDVFGARMRIVLLQLGDEFIELTQYLTPTGRPIPVTSRCHDRWFQSIALVVSNMDVAYAHLRKNHVQYLSSEPQLLPRSNQAAGGLRGFYFRDPDGNNLALIHYPQGQGDRRWQRRDSLFLGIDHTAMTVASTETSLKFYHDLLGLEVVSVSESYGMEQARLCLVKDAHLHLSELRALDGDIAVVLHEYAAPEDGRPMPRDSRAQDLWHTQTDFISDDIEADWQHIQDAGAVLVSPQIVTLPENWLHFRYAFLARDPDGHALRIIAV